MGTVVERMGEVLPQSKVAGGYNQRSARAALDGRGIEVLLDTGVVSVGPGQVTVEPIVSSDGEQPAIQPSTMEYDLIVWTAALQPSLKPAQLGSQLGGSSVAGGRLVTNMDLTVDQNSNVYALGDVASLTGPAPPTAQSAIQQADLAAYNIVAQAIGVPMCSFEFLDLGEMVKLGSNACTLASEALPGGGVTDIQLRGPLAKALRRFAYAYRFPTREQQVRLSVNFMLEPLLKLLLPTSLE